MSLMQILERAQGGRLFAAVARALDLDAAQTAKAMRKLCPAIATQLHARASEDEDLFQSLLELIADNGEASLLEDGQVLTGSEAIADGNAILDDLYGSRSAAMAALRKVDETLPERELSKLAPISATAVVAALASANRPLALAGAQAQGISAGGAAQGFFTALVSAIVAGLVSAFSRKMASGTTRRRSTGYARTRSRKMTSTTRRRRRTAQASVEDVFRDILDNLGKGR